MNEVKYVLQINIEDFNGQSEGDILGLKFENIEQKSLLQKALPKITKPLMIIGSGKDDVDKALLPELISVLDRNCIICSANENTYKSIVPKIKGHKLVLKTPIDINLCKELDEELKEKLAKIYFKKKFYLVKSEAEGVFFNNCDEAILTEEKEYKEYDAAFDNYEEAKKFCNFKNNELKTKKEEQNK